MKNWQESPCTGCQRVPDPGQCENKECKRWQSWFINRWEQLRRLCGVHEDPCRQCSCPGELCFEACARKKQWEGENDR